MSDLDRQATGDAGPAIDWEYAPCCKKCGGEMDWADCWQIDCEEGEYDEYEEDPINFSPGSYRKCETCEGKSGWWYCPNKACSPQGEHGE